MSKKPYHDELDATDLAVERSRMAAERTMMAWIRTSLSMISFGFTMFKFFQYMQESKSEMRTWEPTGALHMGATLVILGTLILVPAGIQHWMVIRRLKKQANYRFPISIAQITASLITFLGLMAMANLFFHLGPF